LPSEESILEPYAFILLAVSWAFIRKKPAQVQADRQKPTSDNTDTWYEEMEY
jgi:hypothetical protein